MRNLVQLRGEHERGQNMTPNRPQGNVQAALPRVSFKYRSGSAALRCLSDNSVYFAKPSELQEIKVKVPASVIVGQPQQPELN